MITPLVLVPSPILRKQSAPVVLDKKTRELFDSLQETLMHQSNPKGVGLSAPQIGKNARAFATWLADNPDDDPTLHDLQLYLNPRLVAHSPDLTFGPDPDEPVLEGCLSIPKLYGPVPRYTEITLEYEAMNQDHLVTKVVTAHGFLARVIQHELDHLDGVLFIDYSLRFDLPVYQFAGRKAVEIDKSILGAY